MIVLVDLDGVAADWGWGYDFHGSELGIHEHGGVRYAERPTWDLRQGLTEEGLRIHKEIMELPGFYYSLPVIPQAKESIAHLQRGHDVYFVSTPFRGNPSCANDKYHWVRKHFGAGMEAKTILTEHKWMVKGDVLIDDRPEIAMSHIASWEHLCFGRYGYSGTTNSQRVLDWNDAITAVTMMQWERDLMTTKAVGL